MLRGGSQVGFSKKIIKKKQYLIVNNGICAEKYRYNRERREAYREQLGLKKELVLMHVGRFIPLKRQDFLVEVLDALTRMGCDSVLVLVGEGETMEAVKAKAEEMKLKDRVRFLGVRRDIHKLLQMADVFVLPSQYEGVPIAGIEAQAAGLPCLISKGVSKDMKLTEPVTYLSLEKGAVAWAKEALRLSAFKRRDTLEEIKKSGYDMTEAVKVLSKLYMGKSRGERV